MKPIAWVGDARERLREFPADAMRDAGYQLELVQRGEPPQGAFRIVYVAKFAEAVYVLHAFQKKSGKTPRGDIWTAQQRLRLVLAARRG